MNLQIQKLCTFPCLADGTGGDSLADCDDSLDADSLAVSFFTFFSADSF